MAHSISAIRLKGQIGELYFQNAVQVRWFKFRRKFSGEQYSECV